MTSRKLHRQDGIYRSQSSSDARLKIIIDVDPGVDDAQALMMLMARRRDVDVLAITCVAGNVELDQACYNALRVMKLLNATQVPVYRGADSSLLPKMNDEIETDGYHGADGLGDVIDDDHPDMSLLQAEHAVNAITRLCRKHKGEVTLVCLGPLTNLALALNLDPELSRNLKNVVIMGGNIEAKGNITPTGEFNFYKDPEAAYIVLESLSCHVQLVSWETCLNNGIDWEWYDNTLCQVPTKLGEFNRHITQFSTNRDRHEFQIPHLYACDPLALLVAVRPEVVIQSKHVYCSVALEHGLTRGQMIVDWKGQLRGKDGKRKMPNVHVICRVDQELFKHSLIDMLYACCD